MDFTSVITLRFNDLFSSGFRQAESGLRGLQGELSGLQSSGLDKVRGDVSGLGAGLAESGRQAQNLSGAVGAVETEKLSQSRRGIEDINAGLEKIGRNSGFTAAAGHLATASESFTAFSAKLNAMADEPSQLAAAFESSLKNIQVVSGFTADEMDILQGKLLSIGADSVAGPLAVAEAYNDVASGIANTDAHMGVLTSSIILAESGQADLGIATNGLVKVMNAYGFAALDTAAASGVSKLAGGFVKIIASALPAAAGTGTVGVAGAGAAGGMGAAAGASAALGAGLWATLAPILAVVGAIALIAGGAYLIVKNWDAVKAFFVNLWNGITGVFSAAWNGITGIFASAFEGIKNVFMGLPNWVVGLLAVFFPFISIPILIIAKWDVIKSFFASLWETVKTTVSNVINWLPELWSSAVAVFTSAWTAVYTFFTDLWNGIVSVVLGAVNWINGVWSMVVSVFVSAWAAIGEFFAALWNGLVGIVLGAVNWLNGVWTLIVSAFSAAWTFAYTFFGSIFTGITTIVSGVAEWLGGIWSFVVSVFSTAWSYVYDFFAGIWDGIKGVVLGFIEWIGGAIEFIIAPFRRVAEVVGGVLDGIGGFFKGLIGESDTAGKAMETNLAKTTSAALPKPAPAAQGEKPGLWDTIKTKGQGAIDFAGGLFGGGKPAAPALAAAPNPGASPSASLAAMPELAAFTANTPALQTGTLAAPASIGSTPAVKEIGAQTSLGGGTDGISLSPAKMNSPTVGHQASDAFTTALGSGAPIVTPSQDTAGLTKQVSSNPFITPKTDMTELTRQAQPNPFADSMSAAGDDALSTFQAAMPGKTKTLDPAPKETAAESNAVPQSISIQNVYVQAEDCQTLLDFVRQLFHAVQAPAAAAV
jgi:phage-related protein